MADLADRQRAYRAFVHGFTDGQERTETPDGLGWVAAVELADNPFPPMQTNRHHQLKGKLKGFWEYEVDAGARVRYKRGPDDRVVTAALGVNTRIVELAATTIQAEMVEFLLITENGTALNTIGQIRYANWWTIPGAVVWQRAVEVAVPFPAGRGKVVTAAGASDLNFVGQFMFIFVTAQ